MIAFVRESGEAASGTLEAAADGQISLSEARKRIQNIVHFNHRVDRELLELIIQSGEKVA